jgi:D-alanyl-D-alanine carboxypeptidase/D-alanyl-D-alanine-endopeptidase (penicillin-binding protein 4)
VEAKAALISRSLNLPADTFRFGASGNLPGRVLLLPADDGPGERWLLSPHLGQQPGATWLPIRDPGLATATLFRRLAARAGIDLPPPMIGTAPAATLVLARHDSRNLAEITAGLLKFSNNLSAELVGIAAASKVVKLPLTLEDSAAVLAAWWRSRLPDIDWTGYAAPNHSGLTAEGRVSPRQIMGILQDALLTRDGIEDFPSLLPRLGEGEEPDGPPLVRVRAKTGTMDYARGLAGYLESDTGRWFAFVILVTDFQRRTALDAIRDIRSLDQTREARDWLIRAVAFDRALLRMWMRR